MDAILSWFQSIDWNSIWGRFHPQQILAFLQSLNIAQILTSGGGIIVAVIVIRKLHRVIARVIALVLTVGLLYVILSGTGGELLQKAQQWFETIRQ